MNLKSEIPNERNPRKGKNVGRSWSVDRTRDRDWAGEGETDGV